MCSGECPMGTDQAFDAWLGAWTKEWIRAADGFLEGFDLHYIASSVDCKARHDRR
jgi:hypothetical protein